MPETEFYMNEEDERKIIDFLLSSQSWMVPLLRYKSPVYSVIRDIASYLEARHKKRHFFVLHDDWFTSPLEMHEFTWDVDGKKYHHLTPREGGPTIDILFSNRIERQGVSLLTSGSIAYYSWYWDTKAEERRNPPD